MNARDFLDLQDAYQGVYQELDEGLGSAIKRIFSGKKEAEAPKPESRGEQLRKKYNVGPEKSNTSAKRQILDRSGARAERDKKEFGSSKYSKSVANQSKAAHDRYLKAGYSKYGADLPVSGGQGGSGGSGRGSKAAKRAAALNKEEFEFIVNSLIEEGYDLSSYTYDEMYEICLDEIQQLDESGWHRRNPGQIGSSNDPDVRMSKPSSSSSSSSSNKKPFNPLDDKKEYRRTVYNNYGEEGKKFALQRAINKRDALRAKRKASGTQSESFDLFDYFLEYLVAEGYADTNENAIAIMANMSEEWKENIVEEVLDENRMNKKLNVPKWDRVYDRNERDFPNHTRNPERRSSGKLETPNQTTKRVGKQRRQDHVDTRGVKQIPGAKGIRMQFGRAF